MQRQRERREGGREGGSKGERKRGREGGTDGWTDDGRTERGALGREKGSQVDTRTHLPQIAKCQLEVDDVDVSRGINLAVHVDDVTILEAAHHLQRARS